MNPYQVVKDFEGAVAAYTGAPYCVAVNSCTAALMLAVAWHLRNRPIAPKEVLTRTGFHAMAWDTSRTIEIPKRTYVSVPMAIIHAGGRPTFRDEEWLGAYQLAPLPVWDSARLFTSRMYQERWRTEGDPNELKMIREPVSWADQHAMVCTSHHWSKTLGIQQGGCILHDDPEADAWLRRARFDGRTEGVAPKDDNITMVGYHCYMSPETAAQGLVRLHFLPKHNAPMPNDEYPNLAEMEIFK